MPCRGDTAPRKEKTSPQRYHHSITKWLAGICEYARAFY